MVSSNKGLQTPRSDIELNGFRVRKIRRSKTRILWGAGLEDTNSIEIEGSFFDNDVFTGEIIE
jgi:hypothetical protein